VLATALTSTPKSPFLQPLQIAVASALQKFSAH
jgi:hypothetical protein